MHIFLQLQSLGPGLSRTISESLAAFDGIVGLKGHASLEEPWFLPHYDDIGAAESNVTRQGAESGPAGCGIWHSCIGTSNGILIRPG